MENEERAARAAEWDNRTPPERYNSLTQQEKTAFNAFLRGAWPEIQIAWRADTGKFTPISFGKAECEWVPIEFWKYKLTGLRFVEWKEEPPKAALGMTAGSVFVKARISVTDDGLQAYDEAMNFRRKAKE